MIKIVKPVDATQLVEELAAVHAKLEAAYRVNREDREAALQRLKRLGWAILPGGITGIACVIVLAVFLIHISAQLRREAADANHLRANHRTMCAAVRGRLLTLDQGIAPSMTDPAAVEDALADVLPYAASCVQLPRATVLAFGQLFHRGGDAATLAAGAAALAKALDDEASAGWPLPK